VDIAMAQRMLRHILCDKLGRRRLRVPMMRAAVCTPHGSEPIARRAAVETLYGLGARRVELVDTLIAAAVGCGLPVEHPEATMIVVCGAGTTQVAVLSLGSIVAAVTVPVGGDAIDRAVVDHLEAVARRTGKPLLLTEVGFAASAGAWMAPHKEGGTYSEEDQAAAAEEVLRHLLGAIHCEQNTMAGGFHTNDVHTGVWALIAGQIVKCIHNVGLIEVERFGTGVSRHL